MDPFSRLKDFLYCLWSRVIQLLRRKPVLGLCMSGGLLDCLFFYTDVINEHQKCIQLDKPLVILASALRTVNDFGFIIYFLYIRIRKKISLKQIYTRVLLICGAFLPLPQVLLLIATFYPRSEISGRGIVTGFLVAQTVYRLIPLVGWTLTAITSRSPITARKIAGWLLMFFFYSLYFSQITGVIWYNLAITAEISCWRKECITSNTTKSNCHQARFKYYCSVDSKNKSHVTDNANCTTNGEKYDFGRFEYADQSLGNSFGKILYGLRWGLHSLSSFGQSLEPGADAGKNIFTICVILFGMLLFSFLIGLFQMYLQSYTERNLEKHKKSVELRKKVAKFQKWSEASLEELSKSLKPVAYDKGTRIIREGDPIDEVIFVVQGTVWTYTKFSFPSTTNCYNSTRNNNQKGSDFYGEELCQWLSIDPYTSSIPICTKTIQAVTNVKVFVLMAYDFRRIFIRERAARFIQLYWRCRRSFRLRRNPKTLSHEANTTSTITVLSLA